MTRPIYSLTLMTLSDCLLQNDLVVETSLVGVVLNGLSHLSHVKNKAHFAMCLIRGLGGNLNEGSRENFAKEVRIVSNYSFIVDKGMFFHILTYMYLPGPKEAEQETARLNVQNIDRGTWQMLMECTDLKC